MPEEDSTLVLLTAHLSRELGSVSELDQAGPVALDSIEEGNRIFAEVWVKDVSPASEGLTAVFADLAYDGSQFKVVGAYPSEIFALFSQPSVESDVGIVRQLGGATMEAGHGAGTWARVAIVELEALANVDVPSVVVRPSAGQGISARGRGLIPDDHVRILTHRRASGSVRKIDTGLGRESNTRDPR